MTKANWPRILVRLPEDAKEFLVQEAARNASSQNSEVVRCIKIRMDNKQTGGQHDKDKLQTS